MAHCQSVFGAVDSISGRSSGAKAVGGWQPATMNDVRIKMARNECLIEGTIAYKKVIARVGVINAGIDNPAPVACCFVYMPWV